MSNPTFKGLSGDQALLEFALCVLHTMLQNSVEKLDKVFDEGKEGNVLDEEVLESLRTDAKNLLPVYACYENGKEAEMKKFSAYRDRILEVCNI